MAESAAPQFRRAVVALSGGRTDRPIVALAAELARTGQADLVGIHVVEIDWTLPLDADVAGQSEDAQRVLDIAETTAEASRYKMETVLLQARDVGAAIVDEATEREADLVIAGLPFQFRVTVITFGTLGWRSGPAVVTNDGPEPWSLLGPRGIDILAWESFGQGWVTDVVKQAFKPARMVVKEHLRADTAPSPRRS